MSTVSVVDLLARLADRATPEDFEAAGAVWVEDEPELLWDCENGTGAGEGWMLPELRLGVAVKELADCDKDEDAEDCATELRGEVCKEPVAPGELPPLLVIEPYVV